MNTLDSAGLSTPSHYTTVEVAKLLGMAVRSIQLMVDRGELQAWKTPGGHRRISRESVERWQRMHAMAGGEGGAVPAVAAQAPAMGRAPLAPVEGGHPPRVLLIEDSVHFQNLVRLLVQQQFPQVELHIANDGITGLALYGQTQPDILIVDILLPDLDGATLITTLRSRPPFARSKLVVITSLDVHQRDPYAFALDGVTVIHKPRLVHELPAALRACLVEEHA
ncbi:MAG: helix-turn-helix domain-containing protein [Burkholderiaceae bacterium]|nr:MAG: helix-turn-helix domain-containing protein [Burkholderiaceae bacterium]